ncbi:phosphonate metabolism protein [Escherichia coli]|nr:phosphonate metabolism protein [Escherichia coli]
MHADTATRQHWMSVLAHSQPTELAARLNALNITADYEVIRAAETGQVQIQARMGSTGERFFAGDATLTRAAVRLTDGTLGYSWVLGRDKQHRRTLRADRRADAANPPFSKLIRNSYCPAER